MRSKMNEVGDCYAQWLRQNPELGGQLKVRFRISQSAGQSVASIDQVSIADGGISHFALEGCVMNVVQSLKFTPPAGGVMTVSYPFVFAPAGPPDASTVNP